MGSQGEVTPRLHQTKVERKKCLPFIFLVVGDRRNQIKTRDFECTRERPFFLLTRENGPLDLDPYFFMCRFYPL